jgi:hypothetical protein
LGGGPACGRRVPDPSSLSSSGGNHPGLVVSSRLFTLWYSRVRLDTTSPGWLCEHRRQRRGIRDNPTCGKESPYFKPARSPQRSGAGTPEWATPTPQVGVSRIPRRVGGRSRAGRAGGVKSNANGPRRRRSDLTPPDRSASLRRRRDGESGTHATTSNDRRLSTRPPHPRSEAARRAGAAGGPLLTLGAPYARPPAARPTHAQ